MALDIRKVGKTPRHFERPEGFKKIPHARRYFSGLFGRAFSVLFLLAAFVTPLSFLDFGAAAGAGRMFFWFALAGLAVVCAVVSSVLLSRNITYERRAIHPALAGLAALAFVSALAGLGPLYSLSFSAFTAAPLVLAFGVGLAVVFVLANLAADPRFLKLVLVSHFLGSTVACLAIVARFASGGYGGLLWVESQSWLAVFAINVFLLLSFAMLQKGAAKTVWTMGIILHLIVLFLWDRPAAWLVLLAGTSALLAFQMLYAKKLWQRNFTYPLQIWVVSLLLLIAPVKLFTGISVPSFAPAAAGGPAEIVDSLGWRALFGVGPSFVERAMLAGKSPSFFDLSQTGLPLEAGLAVSDSGRHILIENGMFGLAAWLAVLGAFVAAGWRFVKKNLTSIKEETMAESVYLGVTTFISAALLAVLAAFFPWAFPLFWLLVLLLGASLGFMAFSAGASSDSATTPGQKITRTFDSGRKKAIAQIAVFALVAFYLVSVVGSARTFAGSRAAIAASRAEQSEKELELLGSAAGHSPAEARYRVLLSRAEAAALGELTPLDEQRDILERANASLSWVRDHSRDPLAHWAAGEVYASLESVAQGSVALARESYLSAAAMAPASLPLPVAMARFYRLNADALALGSGLAASELRAEAKSHLGRALKLVPEYVPARLELALITEQEQGIAAAIAELAPWEETSPEIRYHIGRLHFNDGAFETSVEKFRQVLTEAPNHSNAHYSLGVAYYRLERYEDSLREFETVLRMNPGSLDVEEKLRQVREKL